MALTLKDRVMETTATTGTGALTLAGAVTGYQAFSAVGDGNTCPYTVYACDSNGTPTGDWETGIGTYTLSGTTLARTTVLASSNSGSAVNLSAGTKRVFSGLAAELAVVAPGGEADVDNLLVTSNGTRLGSSGVNYMRGGTGLYAGGSTLLLDANFNIATNCIIVNAASAPTVPFSIQGVSSQSAPLAQLWGISSTSTARAQAEIDTAWNDSTDATRSADLIFRAYYTTTAREGLRIRGGSSDVQIGFYGVTPISRALLATGAAHTVDDVITALQNLGLVKQS